jgi:hypothetical protein
VEYKYLLDLDVIDIERLRSEEKQFIIRILKEKGLETIKI